MGQHQVTEKRELPVVYSLQPHYNFLRGNNKARQYELVRPKDSIEEFDTWFNLNELILLGSHSLTFQKLTYHPETDEQANKS